MSDPIAAQLDQLPEDEDDWLHAADALAASWVQAGVGIEVVEPILRYMERNPHLDFGAPGTLIHYAEQFDDPAYEELLIASLRRRPTSMTALMLNRAINGAEGDRKALLLGELAEARRHPQADEAARMEIDGFLQFQGVGGV